MTMTDLIRRADAIEAMEARIKWFNGDAIEDRCKRDAFIQALDALSALPSADAKGGVISAEKLKRMKFVVIKGDKTEEAYRKGWNGAIECVIDNVTPSAEAVQGEWIDTGNWMGIECSRCKCHSRYVTPFCPQCGARMKGGDSE